jgi:hypothetical protein
VGRPLSNQTVQEPEAIEAVLRDVMCRWVEGLMSPVQEKGWKVRCLLEHFVTLPKGRCVVAGSISLEGLERLRAHKQVELSFVDDWSRVVFQSQILEITEAHVVFALPERIDVFERRQFPRFRTDSDRKTCPLLVPQDTHLSSRDLAQVLDISVGGLCAATHSRDIVKRLRKQPEGIPMKLELPEFQAQEVSCQLRWVKPDPVPNDAGQELTLGLAFHEPARDFLLTLGRYIKRIQGMTTRGV